jgi:O-antigen/teichoic acid export membrane protein
VKGTRRNIAANVVGRIWGAVSFYLFAPIYLRLMGPEAYGLVGFYGVFIGVFVIADLGLTSTMSRELARIGKGGEAREERRDLIRTLEVLHLGVAAAVGVALVLLAPMIAGRWLQARALPAAELTEALRLMGVAVALQLPGGLYFGGLLGQERLVAANALQIGWNLVRSAGAAVALWLWAPTPRVFFLVVAAANLVYLLAIRFACWRASGGASGARFRTALLARTWRYSAGIAGMAVLSSLLSQLDKVVVSRFLPLETFAHYSLVATLAQVPVIVGAAIATALFPRFTGLAAGGATDELRRIYHSGCQLVSVIGIPLGLTLAAFVTEVLRFWTRSPATAATAAGAGALLLVGSTALTLQLVPYQLALAFGWVGLNLRLASISLVLMVPVLGLLVSRFGLIGAGWAWLALNVATTLPMIVLLHRRVLPGATRPWLLSDVGRPLVATLAILIAARWLAPREVAAGLGFAAACAAGAAALGGAALVSPGGRAFLRELRPAS